MMIRFVDIDDPDTTAAKLKYNIDSSDLNLVLDDFQTEYITENVAVIKMLSQNIFDCDFMNILEYLENSRVCLQLFERPIFFEKCGDICYNAYTDETNGQEILELRFEVKIYVGQVNE